MRLPLGTPSWIHAQHCARLSKQTRQSQHQRTSKWISRNYWKTDRDDNTKNIYAAAAATTTTTTTTTTMECETEPPV
jgi:hypothetical protein